mgnify:CR=1 FL=1
MSTSSRASSAPRRHWQPRPQQRPQPRPQPQHVLPLSTTQPRAAHTCCAGARRYRTSVTVVMRQAVMLVRPKASRLQQTHAIANHTKHWLYMCKQTEPACDRMQDHAHNLNTAMCCAHTLHAGARWYRTSVTVVTRQAVMLVRPKARQHSTDAIDCHSQQVTRCARMQCQHPSSSCPCFGCWCTGMSDLHVQLALLLGCC